MSKARQLAGLALVIGAIGFGIRAASAYRKSEGQVWLDYEPPTTPAPRRPINIDLGFLDNWFGGGGSTPPPNSNPMPPVVYPPSGGAGYTPPSATPITGAVDRDTLTLARTIYGEAAQESQRGKEAVANVVMNRVRSRRWPSGVADVCLQPWQFSCWNAADPMRRRIENMQPGHNSAFNQCLAIARRAVDRQLGDHTNGATHYYASYIPEPRWIGASPNAVMTLQVGVHKFYKGIA